MPVTPEKTPFPPLPNASDVVGFPVDADMQWAVRKGEQIIRVFYRYRGKNVPEPIATEMREKIAQREKAGKGAAGIEIRRYLGVVHDGVFYPTDAFRAKPKLFPKPIKSMKGRRANKLDEMLDAVFSSQYSRLTNPENAYSLGVGATGILTGIAAQENITNDLYAALCDVFPEKKAQQLYAKILTVALFMAHTGEAGWHIEHWSARRVVPAKLLPSQATQLFAELGPKEGELRAALTKRRLARRGKGDLLALDGTNSPCNAKKVGLAFVGMGKEGALQRQIVLSYLYSVDTGLPVTYQIYPGNMADASSLAIYRDLWKGYGIKDSEALSTFDRGYPKVDMLIEFIRTKIPFLCAVKTNLSFVQKALPPLSELFQRKNQIDGTAVFGVASQVQMNPKEADSKVFLHTYFSPEVLAKEMEELSNRLMRAKQAWNQDGQAPSGDLKKLFKTPVKNQPLEEDEAAVNQAYSRLGFFAFVSNTVSSPAVCLARYGLRNGVEVCFKTAKNTTGMTTLRAHNDATMLGKIFVNFVAVMMASAVLARMRCWHIPDQTSADGCEVKLPLCRQMAFRKLLHEVDAVFLHKEPKCESFVVHETDRINRIVRQLRLPANFFDSSAKLIDLITRVPQLPTEESHPSAPAAPAPIPATPPD